MPRDQVLLVLRPEPAEVVLAVLAEAGVEASTSSAREAADGVLRGVADVVVCERQPGWQALILRVQSAGGAALILGPRPGADDTLHRHLAEIESVEDIDRLVEAVTRARALRAQRREMSEERSVAQRLHVAEQVARFAHAIASQLDMPQLVAETIARVRDLCDADGASLLLVDPATGELCFDSVSGPSTAGLSQLRLQPGQGIAGRVARDAVSAHVEDVTRCPDFDSGADATSGFSTGSIIAAPLLHRGDVLGVVEAVRTKERPAFSRTQLERLEALAPHVTIAVQNARVNLGLREAQTEILQTNAALEEKVRARTAQIGRAKREWEATFDAIQEPLALQDGFVIRRANHAYAHRVGVAVTQVPGQLCHVLLAGRQTPCERCPLVRGGDQALQAEIELSDGTLHSMNAFPLPDPDTEAGSAIGAVVVHYRDVTDEKHLAARLRESERMAALGQLASGAAHEINNPIGFLSSNLRSLELSLNDLREAVEILQNARERVKRGEALTERDLLGGESSESLVQLIDDGKEIIAESLDGAHRVSAIVKGLRELARQEFSDVTPSCVNASLSRALRTELGTGGEAMDLELIQELESIERVRVAPLQLDQLFAHVLRNAKQALGEKRKIRVRTHDLPSSVVVEIEDAGCGIRPEHVRRVFEPFFTTRGVGQGIGLGLTAAYGVVSRTGGNIDVSSRIGEGTRIRIEFPRADAPGAGPTPIPVFAS